MPAFSSGELCAQRKTKLLHKERLRTTIKCPPQQRMPGLMPLERLCHSDLAGILSSNRQGCSVLVGSLMLTQSMALRYLLPVGSTGALGQPYSNRPKVELPPAQACRSLCAGTSVCDDSVPNKKIPEVL